MTSIFSSGIAAVTAVMREALQRVQRTVIMRIFYSNIYRPNIWKFDNPTWREDTSDLPIYRV